MRLGPVPVDTPLVRELTIVREIATGREVARSYRSVSEPARKWGPAG